MLHTEFCRPFYQCPLCAQEGERRVFTMSYRDYVNCIRHGYIQAVRMSPEAIQALEVALAKGERWLIDNKAA